MATKVFISLPMSGLTDAQIVKRRDELYRKLQSAYNDDAIELIDSFVPDNPPDGVKNFPLWYLGKSIELLSQADAAFFAIGWESARGCQVEHDAAKLYGIGLIHESQLPE